MSRQAKRIKQSVLGIPGVGPARRKAVAAARRNAVLRRLVRRLYLIDDDVPTPMDVSPGTVVGGMGWESLPVTLVVILGADPDTLEQTVDEVAVVQRVFAGFRPVLVTDQPCFRIARRYGYPIELLLAEAGWDEEEHGCAWLEYTRERVGLLFATYRATTSLVVGPDGLDDQARLLLSSLRPAVAEPAPEGEGLD